MRQNLEYRDDLSGLFNRRYFGHVLPRLLKEAQVSRQPLSLVVIDIDYFKTINDTYGHAHGDRVIREFSEFLERTVKKTDIVCRYGGDEFVCILPRTDYGQSLRVCQRILEETRQREFARLKVTTSIGIATYPDHGEDGLSLFESADQDLYAAKRHGRDRVGLHSEREPGLQIPAPEVVGRRTQLSEVRAFMSGLEGGVVAVSGPAGIGKSTFVNEIIRGGEYQKQTLSSVMSSTTQAISYFPFREILRNLAKGQAAVSLRTLARPYQMELAKVVPELLRGGKRSSENTLMVDKYRLFEGVKQALEQTNEDIPRLLVLDNIHWADQGSLELLQYLGRTLKGKPVYFFLIYREEDLAGTSLQQTLESLSRETNFRNIYLDPLSGSDVTRLLLLIADAVPPADLIKFVIKQTGGNPFFIEEQMKALLEGGALSWEGRRLQYLRDRQVPIPDSIEGVAVQKMKKLDLETQEVVELAAVLGREANFELMQEISCLPQGRLFHAMDNILRLKLMVETEPERYYFPENLIRDAIYQKLTPIKLRYYHQRVAQALFSKNNSHPGDVAEELSFHFLQACDYQQALIYSLEAAERSKMAYANSEAIMYYTRALKCLQNSKDYNRMALMVECYIKRAEVYANIGSYHQATTDLKRAIVGAKEAFNRIQEAEARMQLASIYNSIGRFGDASKAAQEALALYTGQGQKRGQSRSLNIMGAICIHRNDYRKAIEYFNQGLELADVSGDVSLVGKLYNNLGAAYSSLGSTGMSREHFHKAVALARQHNNLKLEAQALNNLALELANNGDLEGGLSHHQQALRIFQQLGNRREEAICLNNIGLVYMQRSDFARAGNLFQRSLSISREIENQRDQANTLNNLGAVHIEMGEYITAGELLAQGLELAEQIAVRRIAAHILENQGYLSIILGTYSEAVKLAERALDIWKDLENSRGQAESHIVMGEARRAQGDYKAADAAYSAALKICDILSLKWVESLAWLGLTEAAIDNGNPDEALKSLKKFWQNEKELAPDMRARGLYLEGRLSKELGNLEQAEQNLSLAASIYATIGKPLGLAVAKYYMGELKAQQGIVNTAKRLQTEARKLFREIGAKGWLAKIGNRGKAKITSKSRGKARRL